VFSFDNSGHSWAFQNNWLKVYGVQGQNDLLSMDRAVTDVPLSWDQGGGLTAALQATDFVPVLWIGDVAAGETINFTLYFETSSRFYTDAVGFFVTPEPMTMGLLAVGLVTVICRRKAKK
jgi:hypothetical protein